MRSSILASVMLACVSPEVVAQPAASAATRGSDGSAAIATVADALTWRSLGPARGGGILAVAGSASRPREYVVGTAGGGVFRTDDAGVTWRATSDPTFGGPVSAVAISEANPLVVYAGGGSVPGDDLAQNGGIFRSADGGERWEPAGLADALQLTRIRVHPANPDIVWVAVLGDLYAASAERGIFKTIDGGRGWRKVFFRDDSTGALDLAVDPTDPNVLYASSGRVRGTPSRMAVADGRVGGALLRSTDGGESWTDISRHPGLPAGITGAAIAVATGPNGRAWVAVASPGAEGGVFRSDDGGGTWARVASEERLTRSAARGRVRLVADPRDGDVAYYLGSRPLRTADGGRSWRDADNLHQESLDLWIAPNDSRRLIHGSGAGAAITLTGGRSWQEMRHAGWRFSRLLATGGDDAPLRVCAVRADHTALCPVPPRRGEALAERAWREIGGDSAFVAVHPAAPDVFYLGNRGGYVTRRDVATGRARTTTPWPMGPEGRPPRGSPYRARRIFPLVTSARDARTVYAAGNVLFRSTDGGEHWQPISPDLTRRAGAPAGGEAATIVAVSESPAAGGVIWTGSDDGAVQVTRDGGGRWRAVTPRALAAGRITAIEASPHAAGVAYVAADRARAGDPGPRLYRTTDYGATWTRITTGLPDRDAVLTVRADPVRRGLLFAGTTRGAWVSADNGARWHPLRRGAPRAAVTDLALRGSALVAATDGRSLWMIDDMSPLRQADDALAGKRVHLFRPADARRVGRQSVASDSSGAAIVHYYLRDAVPDVRIEVVDAQGGAVIRTYDSRTPGEGALPTAPGLHRAAWDLRLAGAAGAGPSARGPLAMPGHYVVRLVAGGITESQPLQLLTDRTAPVDAGAASEQRAFLGRVQSRIAEASDALRVTREVQRAIAQRLERVPNEHLARVQVAATVLGDRLARIENALQPSAGASAAVHAASPRVLEKFSALSTMVAGADERPSGNAYTALNKLSMEMDKQSIYLREALVMLLPRLNAVLGQAGLAPVEAPARAR